MMGEGKAYMAVCVPSWILCNRVRTVQHCTTHCTKLHIFYIYTLYGFICHKTCSVQFVQVEPYYLYIRILFLKRKILINRLIYAQTAQLK